MRLVEVLGLGEPEQVHRLQRHRASAGTVAAADTGLRRRPRREQRRRLDEQAVAGLGQPGSKIGQGKAHQRAAHHHLLAVAVRPRQRQQAGERRTDQCLDVGRSVHRAGKGDDAADQRLAVQHRAADGVDGGDVEALHAVFGGAHAVRNGLAGQHVDQLLGATAGVFGWHCHHAVAVHGGGGLHRGDGLRLVILDADQHLVRLQRVAGDGDAVADGVGALAHQAVVAADIGFALGTVDDQRFQRADAELEMAGEHRAAEADDAHLCQEVADLGAAALRPVVQRLALDPALLAVAVEGDAQFRQAGRVGKRLRRDGADHAGSRRVHRGRQAAVGGGDQLALGDTVTDGDAGARGITHALAQRDVQLRRQRRLADRCGAGLRLVFRRVDAAGKIEQRHHGLAPLAMDLIGMVG